MSDHLYHRPTIIMLIEAFKTNGIDYLLKPIEEERLRKALEKVKQFSPVLALEKILALANTSTNKTYKSRFLVRARDKIKSIPLEEILVFYSLEKATFIHTTDHRNYCIDYALEQLEALLDPSVCFKINRKYIVSIKACTNILAWSNSRFGLRLKVLMIRILLLPAKRFRISKTGSTGKGKAGYSLHSWNNLLFYPTLRLVFSLEFRTNG